MKQELEAEYLAILKKTVAMHEVFLCHGAAHPILRKDLNFYIFLEGCLPSDLILLTIKTIFFLFFWSHCMACEISVPQPEIKPAAQQWKHNILPGPPGKFPDLIFFS